MQYRLSTLFLIFFVVAASLASFGGGWGLLVSGIALLAALSLYLRRQLKFVLGQPIVSIIFVVILAALLLPAIQPTRECPGMPNCSNNLKQIALALHNYHDVHGHFPAVATCDNSGKPLYSWMVAILPNMEYDTVYNSLNKDDPWNSPHNVAVLGGLQIAELTCPQTPRKATVFSANYIAITGPGTIWRADGVVKREDLRNASLVVAAVECAGSGKHWAEPYTLTAEESLERMTTGKGMRISSGHPDGSVSVAFGDGSVRSLPADMPIALWRKLLMGELKSLDELEQWTNRPGDGTPLNVWINHPPPPPDKWPFFLSVLVWLVSLGLLFYRAWKTNPIPAVTNSGKTEDNAS
jgi:hypothetical protein